MIPLCDFLARPAREALADYSFTQVRESPPGVAEQIGLLLVLSAIPVLIAVWRCGVDFRRSGVYPAVALANIVALSVSLFGQAASTLIYVGLVAYCFSLSTLLGALATEADEVMRGFLSAVALTLGAILCLVMWDANYSYGRLMGRSGPNYWGMVSIAALFGALALRSILLKSVIVIIALSAIYLCQSRGTMLAILVGGGVLWMVYVCRAQPFRRLLFVGATVFVGLGAAIVFGDFVATKLLLIENRGRGLDSGGTGRFNAWVQTAELFAQSPWFGVGYRQHERLITAASSAHSAYLASLAETGIIGFTAYLALMVGAAVLAVRKALALPDGLGMAVVGLTTSFLVIGIVERVGISTGNTLGLAMIYAAAWAFRSDPGRGHGLARTGRGLSCGLDGALRGGRA